MRPTHQNDSGLSGWQVVTRIVFGGIGLWIYAQTIERFGIADRWRARGKKQIKSPAS